MRITNKSILVYRKDINRFLKSEIWKDILSKNWIESENVDFTYTRVNFYEFFHYKSGRDNYWRVYQWFDVDPYYVIKENGQDPTKIYSFKNEIVKRRLK